MTSEDDDAEISRMLAMTEEELRAYVAAQGLEQDADFAALDKLAQVEMMEKALFGATLDNIMSFADLTDLEIRPVGFTRQNQEPNSTGLEPARPRRADPVQARDSMSQNPPAEKVRSDPGTKLEVGGSKK